tara:strand:- start:188 stop:535 length:348 start_codon:yes stop_codon:yes gene_type:complete
MNNVIIDTIIGGILFGVISHISKLYGSKPNFYKILAFIWSVPLTFFLLIYIVSRNGKSAIKDFSIHAIIGTFLTLIVALQTIILLNYNENIIIISAFCFAFIFTFLYFYLKIYKY